MHVRNLHNIAVLVSAILSAEGTDDAMDTNINTFNCGYGILTLQQHAGCRGNGSTIYNDVCMFDCTSSSSSWQSWRISIYSLIPPPIFPHTHTYNTIRPHIPKESPCSSHGQVVSCWRSCTVVNPSKVLSWRVCVCICVYMCGGSVYMVHPTRSSLVCSYNY